MKVSLKPNIDNSQYPIVECIDKSLNEYLNFDTLYEVIQITANLLEKQKYDFKYKIITNNNKYGYDFPADIFDIIDNKIDDDWVIVENDEKIIMAPKSINYQGFWENYIDGNIEEEKIYCVRFGHIVQNEFNTKWYRKIFKDYQDPTITVIGKDAEFDNYVICPYCLEAEQANLNIGVIKCKKCGQEFNSPFAKFAPNGIKIINE